jgi:hypothetical protein
MEPEILVRGHHMAGNMHLGVVVRDMVAVEVEGIVLLQVLHMVATEDKDSAEGGIVGRVVEEVVERAVGKVAMDMEVVEEEHQKTFGVGDMDCVVKEAEGIVGMAEVNDLENVGS